LRDLTPFWGEWVVCALLLSLFLIVQSCMPVAGCPTGYIGPGGLADNGALFGKNCIGGAHRKMDVLLFGDGHFYKVQQSLYTVRSIHGK
jgi:heparan-alpha-glucosaminide N-acetyltransferase